MEDTQPYPGSLPAGGLQCRERNRRTPLQTSSRVEDRRGGAHEERSWTRDSGGLPPGQLIVLLGASIEVSADFILYTNHFKHVKENQQNFHETLFFKPLSGRILDSVLFVLFTQGVFI